MKRAVLVFVLAAMFVATTALWFFSKTNKITTVDIVGLGVIALVIGFAVFIGYKRLTSAKRGEPAEDELSKKGNAENIISFILHFALPVACDNVLLRKAQARNAYNYRSRDIGHGCYFHHLLAFFQLQGSQK